MLGEGLEPTKSFDHNQRIGRSWAVRKLARGSFCFTALALAWSARPRNTRLIGHPTSQLTYTPPDHWLMKQSTCRSAQQIEHLPSWVGQLGTILLAISCAIPLAGQEQRQPVRLLAAGEVRISISLRGEASELRIVLANRVVEDGDLPNVPWEPSPKIVHYFELAAEEQIADIDHACQLDERQKSKLKLAAMGDMSRFAREMRQTQEKSSRSSLRNQRDMLDFVEDIKQLNLHLSQGVMREGSMFLRVLKSQLTPEQSQRLAREGFDRICKSWSVLMSEEEREQLWTLMQRQNEQVDEQPVFWTPDHFRGLIDELTSEDLVGFLDIDQIEAMRGWCRR